MQLILKDAETVFNEGNIDAYYLYKFIEEILHGDLSDYADHIDNERIGINCQHPDSVLVNVKAATASTEGYTGNHRCACCGQLLEKGQPVPVKKSSNVDTDKAQTANAATGTDPTATENIAAVLIVTAIALAGTVIIGRKNEMMK